MSKEKLILTGDNSKDDRMLMQRQARKVVARQYVDFVLSFKGKDRWIATQRVFLKMSAKNRQAHEDAVREAHHERINALDPVYGRSAQTLGGSHRGVNSNNLRQVAIFPEGLTEILKQFDPHNLALPTGEQYNKNWHKVFKAFPEYRTTEKL